MTACTVREFALQDVSAANALTNHYIVHTPIHFSLQPASDQEFQETWIQGAAQYPWLAAERDGRFLGYAKGGVWRSREAYRNTVEVGLYVVADAHGTGVGKALYTSLLATAQTARLSHGRCGHHVAQRSVGCTARKNGISGKLGEFSEVGYKFGTWHSVGFWQRDMI